MLSASTHSNDYKDQSAMNIYTIYKATNIINDKVYIGFTSYTTEERTAAHLNNSKRIKK